jgi:hypothetical protein
MRIGTMRVRQRTFKGLYIAAGTLTLLVVGLGLSVLFVMLLLPEAREATLR